MKDRESTRLVKKEVSELWKVPTHEIVSLVPSRQKSLLTPATPKARKIYGIRLYLPGVYTPRRISSQILVMRFLHFLHAPTQNSQDLEKSSSSCDSKANMPFWGPKIHRRISLLRVSFKIFEKLICARVEPIIDLSIREVDRRSGHLADARHQDSLLAKAGAVFLDIAAAWLRQCVTSRLHQQVNAIATCQAHGSHDHGGGWQLQLHLCRRYQ